MQTATKKTAVRAKDGPEKFPVLSRADLFCLLAVRDGTGGVPAGLEGQVVISFDQGQVVARPQLGLQEERGADAAQLAVGNDGDAVAEDVGLIHVVRGQQDGAAWQKRKH